MLKKLSPEEISKNLEKLPENQREAFFSLETADKISKACEKYELPAEKIPFVVNFVGQALLGILPQEEIGNSLEKEAGLRKDVAQGINQEINREIFLPLKVVLQKNNKEEPLSKTTEVKDQKKEKHSLSTKDAYREPII